jgi:hypothetical protein
MDRPTKQQIKEALASLEKERAFVGDRELALVIPSRHCETIRAVLHDTLKRELYVESVLAHFSDFNANLYKIEINKDEENAPEDTCPQCGGEGWLDYECDCMDSTCCCLEPSGLLCAYCRGDG